MNPRKKHLKKKVFRILVASVYMKADKEIKIINKLELN